MKYFHQRCPQLLLLCTYKLKPWTYANKVRHITDYTEQKHKDSKLGDVKWSLLHFSSPLSWANNSNTSEMRHSCIQMPLFIIIECALACFLVVSHQPFRFCHLHKICTHYTLSMENLPIEGMFISLFCFNLLILISFNLI